MSAKRIPRYLIIAAKAQDTIAIKAILQHYKGTICRRATITLRNSHGKLVKIQDPDLMQIIATKLILAIILKFDPNKPPQEG